MPEYPDLMTYRDALEERVLGATLDSVDVRSVSLLKTWRTPLARSFGRRVEGVWLLGKRLVFSLDGGAFVAVHLMVSGRLAWDSPATERRRDLAATFVFSTGRLALTEAGSHKRAGLFVFGDEADDDLNREANAPDKPQAAAAAESRGAAASTLTSAELAAPERALRALDRGGLQVLDLTIEAFEARLLAQNRTLKRALTDPAIFAAIGNAYSDEILFWAQLSPVRLTSALSAEERARLYAVARAQLTFWHRRLTAERASGFPGKVTAFRDDMAVHGRFGLPCCVCTAPVQRIRYKTNETNYCARCQNEGRILADRSLSRLLRDDWPRHLDELED